jgi:hypothetical protein
VFGAEIVRRALTGSAAAPKQAPPREDNLPVFVSESQAQLTRQAVNYIARLAGRESPRSPGLAPHAPTLLWLLPR